MQPLVPSASQSNYCLQQNSNIEDDTLILQKKTQEQKKTKIIHFFVQKTQRNKFARSLFF